MCEEHKNTLCKEERLHGRDAVEKLFKDAGSRSMVAFPVRVVYVLAPPQADTCVNTRMLVSVPKRQFKRAVKRNRVKRQIREAYRKARNCFVESIANTDNHYAVAFIYLADDIKSSDVIDGCIDRLMKRLGEKIAHEREVEKGDVKANEGC